MSMSPRSFPIAATLLAALIAAWPGHALAQLPSGGDHEMLAGDPPVADPIAQDAMLAECGGWDSGADVAPATPEPAGGERGELGDAPSAAPSKDDARLGIDAVVGVEDCGAPWSPSAGMPETIHVRSLQLGSLFSVLTHLPLPARAPDPD